MIKSELLFSRLCLTVSMVTLTSCACKESQEKSKPNILFIFADDMTINCLGSTSNGEVKTPNLDRLRKQGSFFTHTFNQGSYKGAVSVASRAMLNTGKYLWKSMEATGEHCSTSPGNVMWPDGYTPSLQKKTTQHDPLWSEYMKEAGYETYMTGKWHVSTPAERVFDHVKHVRGGMPADSKEGYERKFIPGLPDTWTPIDPSFGGYWKGGKHWSEVVTDDALEFIRQAQSKDVPFFMYLAFNAVHDPRQAPKAYQDMYNVNDIKVPENFLPQYPYCEEIGAGQHLRDECLAPFPRSEYSVQVNRKEYYALATHMDKQIGIILDALEKSGKKDNTYILFTADHGLAVGDHGFLGKQNQYEASIRVPMIIVGPDIKKGVDVDNMIYLQDAMATILDLAGSNAIDKVEFQSFLPLAQGRTMKTRDAIIGCYIGTQRMIRTDKYKMIIYPVANRVRLYDLEKDPLEMNDLAGQTQYRQLMYKLFDRFKELQIEICDPLDVTPYFNKFMENSTNDSDKSQQ